jgi:Spy/CpxP family protein refolding chaperone
MKKIMASLAIALMATLAVSAQQTDSSLHQRHRHSFRHHQHDMMAKNLQLSDQQKEQLKTINGDFHKKLMDLKKNEDITIREYKTKMKALQQEHRTAFQSVLSQEQKEQLAKTKEDRMQFAKNHAAGSEKMKARLGLSDAQASQLKNIHTDMVTKIKAIHADSSLTRAQKHEQVKTLALQQKDQLKNILTPDQLQQLQQMKEQHHKRDFSK